MMVKSLSRVSPSYMDPLPFGCTCNYFTKCTGHLKTYQYSSFLMLVDHNTTMSQLNSIKMSLTLLTTFKALTTDPYMHYDHSMYHDMVT